MFSTSNKQQLLNSTEYLNSVVSIGKKTQETFQNQINTNKNNIINKESTLQDLKDAISTYNQQFIELEGKNTEKSITLQEKLKLNKSSFFI